MQLASIAPATERHRVAAHIARAETGAHRRDVSFLDPIRRLVRALLLEELARYRATGRFPKNRDFAQAAPYFIDADGTRCAMAHLLELGGEGELVQRIARERNNARVRELADEPRLLAWLAAAGLTVEEAAAIQPEYCQIRSDCVCDEVTYPVPAAGVLDATMVDVGTPRLARVDSIHGDGRGYLVGEEVEVGPLQGTQVAVGTRVLLPVRDAKGSPDGGYPKLTGVAIPAGGSFLCPSPADTPPALTADQFIDAVRSNDCAGTLAAIDSAWAVNTCDKGGCASVGGGGDITTVGILLAIVAVLARRR